MSAFYIKPFYQKLKQLVENPTDKTWYTIADELHLSYDPSDPIAVECVTFLLIRDQVDQFDSYLEEWVGSQDRFVKANADHLYEAVTIQDYEEIVRSGMPENNYIKDRLQIFDRDNIYLLYDFEIGRIKNEVDAIVKDYRERRQKSAYAYCDTLVFGSVTVSVIVGIFLICIGLFLLYKEYGLYQWSAHILEQYPSISRSYMSQWHEICRIAGVYIFCGAIDVIFPFALKNCDNTFLLKLGKIIKFASFILIGVTILDVCVNGESFFWVYRPLE